MEELVYFMLLMLKLLIKKQFENKVKVYSFNSKFVSQQHFSFLIIIDIFPLRYLYCKTTY
jgi:hypothetical protein